MRFRAQTPQFPITSVPQDPVVSRAPEGHPLSFQSYVLRQSYVGSLHVVLPPAVALVAPSRAPGRPVVVVAAAAVIPAAGTVGTTGVGVGATVLALHGDAVVVAVVAVY